MEMGSLPVLGMVNYIYLVIVNKRVNKTNRNRYLIVHAIVCVNGPNVDFRCTYE